MKKVSPESVIPVVPFDKRIEPEIEFKMTDLQFLSALDLEHSIEKAHRVDFNVIFIVTKGRGVHTVDFTPYSYTPGSMFFIARGQIHQFSINPHNRGYLLVFTDSFLNRLQNDHDHDGLQEIFDYMLYPPKTQLDVERLKAMASLLEMIHEESDNKIDTYKESILKALLQALLFKLKRERKMHMNPLSDGSQRLYTDFKRAVYESHKYTQQVNDYSKKLGVTPKTLSSTVQKYTSKSTKQYLDEWLLLQIKRHLLDEGLSIKEVAERLAFDEPTNLVKFFKRLEGMTPSAFKEMHTLT